MKTKHRNCSSSRKKSLLSAPILAQCELTQNCNHNCDYCYNYWREGHRKPISQISVVQIHELIKRLSKIGIMAISLTGGEPLLCPNIVQEAIYRANEYNIQISINTNASLITDFFIDLFYCEGIHILASLPSSSKDLYNDITRSNNFDIVTDNIKRMTRLNIPIDVNMVVHDQNIDNVFETALFAINTLGVKSFRATPVSPPKHILTPPSSYILSHHNYSKYFKQIAELHTKCDINTGTLGTIPFCFIPQECQSISSLFLGCTSGRSIITVGIDGSLRPCSQSDLSYGNIYNLNMKTIQQYIDEQLSSWKLMEYLPDDCKDCVERYQCCGGCRMHAYNTTGNLCSKDPRMTIKLSGNSDTHRSSKIDLKMCKTLIESSRFKLNTYVKIRQESDNKWIIFSGEHYDVINKAGIDIIDGFLVRGQLIKPPITSTFANFIYYLLQRGYINKLV